MQEEYNWTLRLQQALQKTFEETFGSEWGYHISNNWGFEADIVEEFDKMPTGSLQLEKHSVTSQGVEIFATVGEAVTSLPDISRAVFHLLYAVGENIFVVLPMLDKEALIYWFVIGTTTHGHIGEVIIRREGIRHIDLSMLA